MELLGDAATLLARAHVPAEILTAVLVDDERAESKANKKKQQLRMLLYVSVVCEHVFVFICVVHG